MTRTRSRSAAPVTRRRFLGTALLGSAAAIVAGVPAAAAPARKPKSTRTAKVEAEVAKQKGWLADSLKTIRAYELPPGSEPASVFAAVKAKPRPRGSR